MSNSNTGAKKTAKRLPKWAIALIVVAAILAGIIGSAIIVDTVTKNPGVKVFESYMSAASSQNVEKMAAALYKEGSDDYLDFIQRYSAGKASLEVFTKNNTIKGKDGKKTYTDEYNNFMRATPSPFDDKDDGLLLKIESMIADNIKSYTTKVVRNETYYVEILVTFTAKSVFVEGDYPEKHRDKISSDILKPFTVKFNRKTKSDKWTFNSKFSLLEGQAEVATWYAPYGDGLELKYLNPNDLIENPIEVEVADPDNPGQTKIIEEIEYYYDLSRTVGTKRYLSIGNYAFADCGEKLSRIVLGDYIQNIGDYAFKDCGLLKSVLFDYGNESVSDEQDKIKSANRNLTVGEGVFYGCESLTSFVLPKKNKIIPSNLFNGCSSLQSFEINDGVTDIGHYAFKNCSSLTQIDIKSSVRTIGDGAFDGCEEIKSLTLPSALTRLGSSAFKGMNKIESVEVPLGITSIETGAFEDCERLNNVILPSGIKRIGDRAFKNTSLKTIEIPGDTQAIGKSSFEGCTLLQTVKLSNAKIRIIGTDAFKGCTQLYEFTLPSTVSQIGASAFAGCVGLRAVMVNCGANISIGTKAFEPNSGIPKFYVPTKTASTYKGVNWNHFEIYPQNIIDKDGRATITRTRTGVDNKVIEERVLVQYLGVEGETEVDLKDTVTHIGNGAFAYNKRITSVTFDTDTVVDIGEDAFVGCENLAFEKYALKGSSAGYALLYIEGWLVGTEAEEKGIISLEINTNRYEKIITEADGSIRKQASSLPGTIGIMGGVFKNTEIKGIVLPASITYICQNAFQYCLLSSVDFGTSSNLKFIGKGAFESCRYLTSADIPQTVTEIGDMAFNDCEKLRYVIINNNDKTLLGSNVFKPLFDVLKIYIEGYGDYYKQDESWKKYQGITYNKNVIKGDYTNSGYALIENATDKYTLLQYLCAIGENDKEVDMSSGVSDGSNTFTITEIGNGAFATSVVSKVILPASIQKIGNYAFYSCDRLVNVHFTDNSDKGVLTYIGDYAFTECVELSSSPDGRIQIDAIAPNNNFKMGAGVFDNDLIRKIFVNKRENYVSNEYWDKYKDALTANDDPKITINITIEGSEKVGENKVNGSYEKDGKDYFNAPNQEMKFVATVDEYNGYEFVGWFDKDGVFISDDTTLTVRYGAKDAHDLYEARFKRVKVRLTVVFNETSTIGSVENNGYKFSGTFSELVEIGQTVTLKAAPANSRYQFVDWKKDKVLINGKYVFQTFVSDEAEYTFTMTDDLEIFAEFKIITG